MSVATTAIMLYSGFRLEQQKPKKQFPDIDHLGGFIGLADRIGDFAKIIEDWFVEADTSTDAFPGCFDYEVTQEVLGAWIFHNIHATDDEFKAELKQAVKQWLQDSFSFHQTKQREVTDD